MFNIYNAYVRQIVTILSSFSWESVHQLTMSLQKIWETGNNVFLCGNGGSAGNAIQLANDFIYGFDKNGGIGLRVEALTANQSILTCLAKDEDYKTIFSQKLMTMAESGDILIVLSGSGNSANVVNALQTGNDLEMKTVAILGYSGGQCRNIAQFVIHFPVEDMQIAEDLQLRVGHMCMQRLCA